MRARHIHARQFRVGCTNSETHLKPPLPRVVFYTPQWHDRLRNVKGRLKFWRGPEAKGGPFIGAAPKTAVEYLGELALGSALVRRYLFHAQTLTVSRELVYGGENKQDDSGIMFENLFANSGLSLERLKTFREIVAAGGITAAARDDSNRQSQYSRQLKELEKYFGVELLKRGHGPAELTDAGQRLYEIIGRTLSALDEFRLTCAGLPLELTIGAGESLIQWLLLPRLSGLSAAHPRLTVNFQNLKTDQILEQLVGGALDFGVVSRFEPHRNLMSAPLGKLDFRLFAPAKLLPANERLKVTSEILGQLPLAMLDGSPGIRQAIEDEAQRVPVKLNVRLRFSSYPQLAEAVSNLEVAAIMPRLAENSFEGKAVRGIALPFLSSLSRQISLVWNRRVAEVRPAIARYSRLLPSIFRMQAK